MELLIISGLIASIILIYVSNIFKGEAPLKYLFIIFALLFIINTMGSSVLNINNYDPLTSEFDPASMNVLMNNNYLLSTWLITLFILITLILIFYNLLNGVKE